MRQSDIVVDREYAYQTSDPYDGPPTAARVRVTSIRGHARLTAVVIDPGPSPAFPREPLKRGATVEISTRSVACSWDEWPAHAAKVAEAKANRAADQDATWSQFEESRADRTRVDPARRLPDHYDDEPEDFDDPDERAILVKEYLARLRHARATPDEVAPLFANVPVPVARDIVSAVRGQAGDEADPNSVSRVFARTAFLLKQARIAMTSRAAPRLAERSALLTEAHVAFVWALHEQIANEGGELRLPYVPRLPDWLDDEPRQRAAAFGWLRLDIGDTSGDHLHSTSCHTIRSQARSDAEHMPLWEVELEHCGNICTVCGGPNVRDLLAYAHFTAAVDVWTARQRPAIERWQRIALLRLVAASAESRANGGEPDVTLAARIVDALSQQPPDYEGWAAYAIAVAKSRYAIEDRLDELTPPAREAARALVRDRLTVLEEQLPAARRPLPLPATVSEDVLRDRYRQHAGVEDLPQLERLLFGLPRAR